MRGDVLQAAIEDDIAKGCIPMMVIGTVGTTNTGAIDRIDEIGPVGKQRLSSLSAEMFCKLIRLDLVSRYTTARFYVDAAWAGVALACPEQRGALHLDAINQYADGFSTNFHKWGGVNFDCSALCELLLS